MKKILKALLAVIMVLSFTNVFAANENEGKITISNAEDGKTYEIFRIFDMTLSNDNKVSYTVNSKWKGFTSEYLVDSDSTGTLSTITVVAEDCTTTTKYINVISNTVAAFADSALDYALKNNIAADFSQPATSETVEFENLPLGYYLVYPKGASILLDGNESICSLDSTTPSVELKAKATYPEIEKEVSDSNPEVGQELTYTITGVVPNTSGYEQYTYKVTDTMTAGLTFNKNVVVKFGDTTIETSDTELTYNTNGFVLNFNMVNYANYEGKKITITYTATVNENAINVVSINEAVLTYSTTPTQTTDNTPVKVPVYTTKITILKYDAADSTKETTLANAEFVLYKLDENKDKVYYLANKDEKGNLVVAWTSTKDEATVMITDENGNAEFKGLEDGTYYLEETNPPAGYNLLKDPIEVKIAHSSVTEETTTEELQVPTQEVANSSGTELPSTGGIGTKLFITFGTMIALGAALVFVTNKRMAKEFN